MADPANTKNQDSDLIIRLVHVNRVSKVVKGGRRFSFAALVVAGNGNGMVGAGSGKAPEVAAAKDKATEASKKDMFRVPLRENRTIHHDVTGVSGAGKVHLRSAPPGTGVIAGGPLRAVFEALGIQDIVVKSIGSSNPNNMINACFDALGKLNSPRQIAERRGKNVGEIISRRNLSAKIKDPAKEALDDE